MAPSPFELLVTHNIIPSPRDTQAEPIFRNHTGTELFSKGPLDLEGRLVYVTVLQNSIGFELCVHTYTYWRNVGVVSALIVGSQTTNERYGLIIWCRRELIKLEDRRRWQLMKS